MDESIPSSEAERIFLEWAQGRGYVILPRIWRADMEAGLDLEKKIAGLDPVDLIEKGEPPLGTRAGLEVQKAEAYLYAFRRDVFLPQGIVRYALLDYNRSSGPDELMKYLREGKSHSHCFEWYFGMPLGDWKSEDCDFGRRRRNSLINGVMTISFKDERYSPSGKISLRGEHDHPVIQAIAPYLEWDGSFGGGDILGHSNLDATMVRLMRSFNRSTEAFTN